MRRAARPPPPPTSATGPAAAIAMALPESLSRPAAGLDRPGAGPGHAGPAGRCSARHLRRVHGPELTGRALDRAGERHLRLLRPLLAGGLPAAPPGPAGPRRRPLPARGARPRRQGPGRGEGRVIGTPHVGNWDLGARLVRRPGYQPTTVVEPLEPPELFEWFCSYRRALGMGIVPLGPDAGSVLLKKLREGLMVGLVCDRDLAGNGVEVEFFGERTTFPAGPGHPGPAGRGRRSWPAPTSSRATRHRCIIRPPVDTVRGRGRSGRTSPASPRRSPPSSRSSSAGPPTSGTCSSPTGPATSRWPGEERAA